MQSLTLRGSHCFRGISVIFTIAILSFNYNTSTGFLQERLLEIDDTFQSSLLKLFPVAEAKDMGLLAFFAKACPSGWEAFQDADGRFIQVVDSDASVGVTGGA